MNEQMKAGSDIHAGDGGYREGTREGYEQFAKTRNQSLAQMRIQDLKEQAMEWVPNMADPDTKIRLLNAEKFAESIVRECAAELIRWKDEPFPYDPEFGASLIKEHFGVK
jgi:hypothetical protein